MFEGWDAVTLARAQFAFTILLSQRCGVPLNPSASRLYQGLVRLFQRRGKPTSFVVANFRASNLLRHAKSPEGVLGAEARIRSVCALALRLKREPMVSTRRSGT
jgi:hypothetical protein